MRRERGLGGEAADRDRQAGDKHRSPIIFCRMYTDYAWKVPRNEYPLMNDQLRAQNHLLTSKQRKYGSNSETSASQARYEQRLLAN